MSVTISISPTADDIWIIRNAVYRWLVARVAELHADNPVIAEQLTIAGYVGGISLDDCWRETPQLATEIADALRTTIHYLIDNSIPLTDDLGTVQPTRQSNVYEKLADLQILLDRFTVETCS